MRWLAMALLCSLAGPSHAVLLGEFSCARPAGFDAGTWQNVSLSASLVDGSVVAPGGIFSFLDLMRPAREKFVPGNTMSSGRIIKSRGGGYCQVSTAIYNAALLAGLRVLERYPHSFYEESEAYVEPGRDAAVSSSGKADFRFKNTYPAPVTLSVTALDGRVSVQVFGSTAAQKRWIETQPTRRPARRFLRSGSGEKPGTILRQGHDGWSVSRSLLSLDAAGNTLVTDLGIDAYDKSNTLIAADERPASGVKP